MQSNMFQELLKQNDFVITAEVGPPKGSDPIKFLEKASHLKGYADAFNVTDNQTAVVRLSSFAGSILLQRNGLQPILQMSCRDRNRIALQSDILGASALDITNILFVTGDHQTMGNHPNAKGVFDIDSIQLIQLAKQLRDKGLFQNGEEIKQGRPEIFIGGVCNPFATPYWYRIQRLEKKADAGAEFIQTQSVFDIQRFASFMDMVIEQGLHKRLFILAGITPIKSKKMLDRMKYHVPGVDIPDEIYTRLASALDFVHESITLTLDLMEQIKKMKGISGVHITALFWEDIIPLLVKESGCYPRPTID
ncbi:MAG: methylenetetrahydrofolate reductase [Candidatus Thermoplasmatota archaeon]|nr:methylenetetrahydrofolate reductase [Candidatus Thermoplasmatota archaeon]